MIYYCDGRQILGLYHGYNLRGRSSCRVKDGLFERSVRPMSPGLYLYFTGPAQSIVSYQVITIDTGSTAAGDLGRDLPGVCRVFDTSKTALQWLRRVGFHGSAMARPWNCHTHCLPYRIPVALPVRQLTPSDDYLRWLSRQRRKSNRRAIRLVWKDEDETFRNPTFLLCMPSFFSRKSSLRFVPGGVLSRVFYGEERYTCGGNTMRRA